METIILIIAVLIIGVVIGRKIHKTSYDGKMIVIVGDGVKTFSLELDGDPAELEHKRSISFKVVQLHEDVEV